VTIKKSLLSLVFIISLFSSLNSAALITHKLMMIRVEQSFPETMSSLQQAIKLQGYTVSRVQHVDIGLTAMGFKTDKYRVVFFAKGRQVDQLSASHPELIPYLPLKIAIFAEGDDTLLVSYNPVSFAILYPAPELRPVFERWSEDMKQIFHRVQFSD
jgi:uncharacterized protein (DUF302 family)